MFKVLEKKKISYCIDQLKDIYPIINSSPNLLEYSKNETSFSDGLASFAFNSGEGIVITLIRSNDYKQYLTIGLVITKLLTFIPPLMQKKP